MRTDSTTTDLTEALRRERLAEIKEETQAAVETGDPRAALEAKYGQVWDTLQLQEDFEVMGFMAPMVVVRRKADRALGSLEFSHSPRYYYNFMPDRR